MKEKKHIDRIFQEKFKDFEQEPPYEIWQNIALALEKKKRRRALIIPLWAKIGSVAAVLALIVAGLMFKSETDMDSIQNPVVEENIQEDIEQNNETPLLSTEEEKIADINKEGEEENASGQEGTNKSEAPGNFKEQKASSVSGTKYATNDYSKEESPNSAISTKANVKVTKDPENDQSEIRIADHDRTTSEEKTGQIKNSEEAISETSKTEAALVEVDAEKEKNEEILSPSKEDSNILIAELEKNSEKEIETPETDTKRFSLSTFAAPLFYKNVGGGNEISSEFDGNTTRSDVTVSYGVKLAYELNKKLKIRTGISKIEVNNTTRDIGFSPMVLAQNVDNISGNPNMFALSNSSPNADSGDPLNGPMPDYSENGFSTAFFIPGEINQQFGFIEIPVELEYALIDKKFGLNLIGGGSSLFLDKNSLEIVSGTNVSDLGKATNIKNTSFSANLGLGLDYDLNETFGLSLEPIIKYQLNTFDNVNNVSPLNFGIYTGLKIRF
ncbi:hypothetical protein [Gramella sp. AN32]|uniref:Outer membrane protein beta-barrel domain-containing protein n=1 Tax=Christiangramia antarctica TaxID=2058158 RepID=A0ABW5WZR4_9FLAO|nr:hypothetical protein [Gramella sp. AN32]MCM4155055.1 hypothetical protein [Gramella sp. AN32]